MPVKDFHVEQFSDLNVPADQQARAVRGVASAAVDAADCRTLLEILGLDPSRSDLVIPKPRDPVTGQDKGGGGP